MLIDADNSQIDLEDGDANWTQGKIDLGNGGSASQQMTAEEIRRETERLARQLDRLSRERNDPQMAEVGRALDQASQRDERISGIPSTKGSL